MNVNTCAQSARMYTKYNKQITKMLVLSMNFLCCQYYMYNWRVSWLLKCVFTQQNVQNIFWEKAKWKWCNILFFSYISFTLSVPVWLVFVNFDVKVHAKITQIKLYRRSRSTSTFAQVGLPRNVHTTKKMMMISIWKR